MVCESCEKKANTVICPDVWKDGARNTTESGGRKINENKLLTKQNRMQPYGSKLAPKGGKCKECKANLPQSGQYCQTCAYKKGLCSMCGKKIMDVKGFRQSTY